MGIWFTTAIIHTNVPVLKFAKAIFMDILQNILIVHTFSEDLGRIICNPTHTPVHFFFDDNQYYILKNNFWIKIWAIIVKISLKSWNQLEVPGTYDLQSHSYARVAHFSEKEKIQKKFWKLGIGCRKTSGEEVYIG